MLYLIDGYNLLFRILHKGEEVKKARDEMIVNLGRKVTFSSLKAILVFDSTYQEGLQTEKKEGDLVVVFTNEGQTADDWIVHAVKESEDKANTCIVTTDKRLAKQVRLKGAQTLSCEEFLAYLAKRMVKKRDKPLLKPLIQLEPKKKVAKGSAQYYEEVFEKKLEGAAKEPKKIKPEITSEIPKTKRELRTPESEQDRWSRLFGA